MLMIYECFISKEVLLSFSKVKTQEFLGLNVECIYNMDSVLAQIKYGMSKRAAKVETDIELCEELYIGNLHRLAAAHHRNNHCWTMFVSSSPCDVVPPVSVMSVTWHLHETFRPRRVIKKDPPFYLSRRGWGYFNVQADITLKPEFYSKYGDHPIVIRAVHSIHFGSPLMTHHLQTNMPYLVTSPALQQLLDDDISNQSQPPSLQNALRAELSRRRNANGQNVSSAQNDGEEEQKIGDKRTDSITKQSVDEVVFDNFILSPLQMLEILKDIMGGAPLCVLQCIVEFGTLCPDLMQDGFAGSRVIFDECRDSELCIAHAPEVVIRGGINCTIDIGDIGRMLRVYQSEGIKVKCNGECSSYRFEHCSGVEVDGHDIGQKVVFMTLFSENIQIRMHGFKIYEYVPPKPAPVPIIPAAVPNNSAIGSAAVAELPIPVNPEINTGRFGDKNCCHLVVFRRENHPTFSCSRMCVRPGTSLNQFI